MECRRHLKEIVGGVSIFTKPNKQNPALMNQTKGAKRLEDSASKKEIKTSGQQILPNKTSRFLFSCNITSIDLLIWFTGSKTSSELVRLSVDDIVISPSRLIHPFDQSVNSTSPQSANVKPKKSVGKSQILNPKTIYKENTTTQRTTTTLISKLKSTTKLMKMTRASTRPEIMATPLDLNSLMSLLKTDDDESDEDDYDDDGNYEPVSNDLNTGYLVPK